MECHFCDFSLTTYIREKRSIMWKFLSACKDDPNKLNCSLCSTKIPYVSKTTTNGIYHLKQKHLKEFEKVQASESLAAEVQSSTTDDDDTSVPTNLEKKLNTDGKAETKTNSVKPQAQVAQPSLRKFLKRKGTKSVKAITYGSKSKRKKLIDEALVEFVVMDYQPLSVVEDIGFINLINVIDEKYAIPSRKTLTESLIPTYHNSMENKRFCCNKLGKLYVIFIQLSSINNHYASFFCAEMYQ